MTQLSNNDEIMKFYFVPLIKLIINRIHVVYCGFINLKVINISILTEK